MLFTDRLTHRADNCWARKERTGKASQLRKRVATAAAAPDVSAPGAFGAPNKRPVPLGHDSGSGNPARALLGPPGLQDHTADIVPATTSTGATEATDVE